MNFFSSFFSSPAAEGEENATSVPPAATTTEDDVSNVPSSTPTANSAGVADDDAAPADATSNEENNKDKDKEGEEKGENSRSSGGSSSPKSKSSSKKSKATAKRTMQCHYEVMGLERNCTQDEIKVQFRKLALKWHPDRNHGQEDHATEMFKHVSTSHAVLSDPQERHWYDTHRESILRGGDGTNQDGDDDENVHCANLWEFFNTSCYTDFRSGPTGFYEVYQAAFEEIHQYEEDAVAEQQAGNAAAKKLEDFPTFGDAQSPMETLNQFYQYWDNFVSKLSFTWVDRYDIREAPNRATKRAMEKENAKISQNSKKEYTHKVRSLALFVKKRDPRWIAHLKEVKEQKRIEEEKKAALKLEESRRKKAEKEQRELEYRANTGEIEKREKERKKAFLLADHSSSEDEATLIALAAAAEGDVDESAAAMSERALQNKLKMLRLANKQKAEEAFVGAVSSSAVPDGDDDDDVQYDAGDEEEFGTLGGDGDDAADNEGGDDIAFGCELCKKKFKTEQQLNQHLASRQHRQNEKDQAKKKKKPSKKPKPFAKPLAPVLTFQG